ncbi:hypothetical protein J2T31_002609 [Kerstersia gyiorum]|nr:hypothetical protein [Kerstersia gyiorum]MCP1824370.1 hypothetical protein [Kerstersia gyiorum]MCP1827680.1 hypothetical protein [Kerstersia gyiorum]MCW2451444.1 hypothetical protein [Kerstersia gyiorum]
MPNLQHGHQAHRPGATRHLLLPALPTQLTTAMQPATPAANTALSRRHTMRGQPCAPARRRGLRA